MVVAKSSAAAATEVKINYISRIFRRRAELKSQAPPPVTEWEIGVVSGSPSVPAAGVEVKGSDLTEALEVPELEVVIPSPADAYIEHIEQFPRPTREQDIFLMQVIETGRDAHSLLEAAESGAIARLHPTMKRLLRRAVLHGEKAQESLVQSHLREVVEIAKRASWSSVPLLDLIEEGNRGLISFEEISEYRKEEDFSSGAAEEIGNFINHECKLRGSRRVENLELFARVRGAAQELELQLGRPPTLQEMNAECLMEPKEILLILNFKENWESAPIDWSHHYPFIINRLWAPLIRKGWLSEGGPDEIEW